MKLTKKHIGKYFVICRLHNLYSETHNDDCIFYKTKYKLMEILRHDSCYGEGGQFLYGRNDYIIAIPEDKIVGLWDTFKEKRKLEKEIRKIRDKELKENLDVAKDFLETNSITNYSIVNKYINISPIEFLKLIASLKNQNSKSGK